MKILFSVFCLISSGLSAGDISSWTYDDLDHGWNSEALAKLYFHNSEPQRQWAWEALGKVPFTGDEHILDFGCGDGKISAEMARLARNGTVLGLDVSKNMIHFAKIHFPSYAFPNLAFKASTSLTLADFKGGKEYDLVCAFTVFHLISDPLEVLKNLRAQLKPTGKLLLIIPTGQSPLLYEAANEVFERYGFKAPWSGRAMEGRRSMRTMEGCDAFLREAGYLIESMDIIDTDNAFYDLEDFIAWHVGTATANWKIPLELSQAFFTDLVNRMVEIDPAMIDEEGRVRFKMPRLHVTAALDGSST